MKKIILILSFLATLFIFVFDNTFYFKICEAGDYGCRAIFRTFGESFFIFPLALTFSIMTYRMPDAVFVAWWKFARVATPIILALSYLINSGVHHAPTGELQNIIDIPLLIALYVVFTIGSLIQIIRGYRRSKA